MIVIFWIGCTYSQPPLCDTAADITYAEFGKSFMTQYCQGCHASTSTNRQGAPDSVNFDTLESIWILREDILRVTTSESPSMPPAWAIPDTDIELLQWWLECGSERMDEQSILLFDR